jgi:hypothetical protein
MKIQYYNKIRWGLAPLAPNDATELTLYSKWCLYVFRTILTINSDYFPKHH